MEEQHERETWCKAWRLLRQHGDDTERLVRAEIERSLAQRDRAGELYWREVAAAVAALAR